MGEEEDSQAHATAQYNIGRSQKLYVPIPTFLQKNEGDPAIKASSPFLFLPRPETNIPVQNFLPMLHAHLLPRIQNALREEVEVLPAHLRVQAAFNLESFDPNSNMSSFLILKEDRLYTHKVIRFNFTSYDVRRGTDVVNTGTSRCNIMLLADDVDSMISSSTHHFLYARVIGAYHANVIYIGPGMRDYRPRRFDFLWVRWFKLVKPAASGWTTLTLDAVSFPPMNQDTSFGFVDPKDVLRGCHILPAFAKGEQHKDGVGISRCAKDGKDYKMYYVGRYGLVMLC